MLVESGMDTDRRANGCAYEQPRQYGPLPWRSLGRRSRRLNQVVLPSQCDVGWIHSPTDFETQELVIPHPNPGISVREAASTDSSETRIANPARSSRRIAGRAVRSGSRSDDTRRTARKQIWRHQSYPEWASVSIERGLQLTGDFYPSLDAFRPPRSSGERRSVTLRGAN